MSRVRNLTQIACLVFALWTAEAINVLGKTFRLQTGTDVSMLVSGGQLSARSLLSCSFQCLSANCSAFSYSRLTSECLLGSGTQPPGSRPSSGQSVYVGTWAEVPISHPYVTPSLPVQTASSEMLDSSHQTTAVEMFMTNVTNATLEAMYSPTPTFPIAVETIATIVSYITTEVEIFDPLSSEGQTIVTIDLSSTVEEDTVALISSSSGETSATINPSSTVEEKYTIVTIDKSSTMEEDTTAIIYPSSTMEEDTTAIIYPSSTVEEKDTVATIDPSSTVEEDITSSIDISSTIESDTLPTDSSTTEILLTTSEATVTPQAGLTCSAIYGYVATFSNSLSACLFVSSTATTYTTADDVCRGKAGRLVTMKSLAKRDLILQSIYEQAADKSKLWIGLRKSVSVDLWSDNLTMTDTEKTLPFYGVFTCTLSACGCFAYDKTTDKLTDTICVSNLPYICEQIV
ncbi:hypothetical protein BgiMline_016027 [Biomphalaria glabrata]|nr:hypothetical protein BgiMline_008827 [Biomphalaria glabrata]